MRLAPTGLLTAVAALLAAFPAAAQQRLQALDAGARPIQNQYVCVFSSAYSPGQGAHAEARRIAAPLGARVLRVYDKSLRGFSLNATEQVVRRLLVSNPQIAWCEPDQLVGLDPATGATPGVRAQAVAQPRQTTPWGVTRVNGGIAYQGTNRAWVIDTGIDPGHPDLNVDASRSRSFGRTGDWSDMHGHGSHVAGIIGARNNAIGVVGVAAGAPLVAVRVLEANGAGPISAIIAGVDYVAANAAPGDVANISVAIFPSDALDNAVRAAAARGVRFTLAAGNFSIAAGLYSPGRVNAANVYTISSFGQGDSRSRFSNFGNPPIDFAEPGEAVTSTWRGGQYRSLSGTSMAAPHAAGILLLGAIAEGGQVGGDPDGRPDVIGIHQERRWRDPILRRRRN